jgi:serine/threonine protein kinase
MKPENVLFATTNRDAHDVKIADFGCALIQSRRRKKSSYSTMTSERNIVGTPGYIAPEVLTATPRYSSKCDVWACGVILYIMLVGYPPIHGRNEWEVFSRTRKGAFKFYEQDWVGISSKARKLVQRMLQVDLKKRCSVQQALKDSWFSTSSETELPLTQIRLESLNRKMKEKEVDAEESSSKDEENKEEKDVTLTNTSSTTKPMLIPSRRSRGRSKGSSGGSNSPIRTPGSLTYTDAEIEAIRNSSKKRLSHWKRERAIQRSNELDKITEEKEEDLNDDDKSSKISKTKNKKRSFVTRNKRLKSF